MQHKCKVTVIDKKCFNDYQDSAAKRGTASAVIFTLRFRAAALCAAGLTTNA